MARRVTNFKNNEELSGSTTDQDEASMEEREKNEAFLYLRKIQFGLDWLREKAETSFWMRRVIETVVRLPLILLAVFWYGLVQPSEHDVVNWAMILLRYTGVFYVFCFWMDEIDSLNRRYKRLFFLAVLGFSIGHSHVIFQTELENDNSDYGWWTWILYLSIHLIVQAIIGFFIVVAIFMRLINHKPHVYSVVIFLSMAPFLVPFLFCATTIWIRYLYPAYYIVSIVFLYTTTVLLTFELYLIQVFN